MLSSDKRKQLELRFYNKVVDTDTETHFFQSHFHFLGVVGEGAFGLVIAARWISSESMAVAVKCFCKEDFENSTVELFRKEGKLTSKYQHPKLMKSLGVIIA